jgi:hypothetical protein
MNFSDTANANQFSDDSLIDTATRHDDYLSGCAFDQLRQQLAALPGGGALT